MVESWSWCWLLIASGSWFMRPTMDEFPSWSQRFTCLDRTKHAFLGLVWIPKDYWNRSISYWQAILNKYVHPFPSKHMRWRDWASSPQLWSWLNQIRWAVHLLFTCCSPEDDAWRLEAFEAWNPVTWFSPLISSLGVADRSVGGLENSDINSG